MYETTIVPHNVNFHIVFDYDLPFILTYTLTIHETTLQPLTVGGVMQNITENIDFIIMK